MGKTAPEMSVPSSPRRCDDRSPRHVPGCGDTDKVLPSGPGCSSGRVHHWQTCLVQWSCQKAAVPVLLCSMAVQGTTHPTRFLVAVVAETSMESKLNLPFDLYFVST